MLSIHCIILYTIACAKCGHSSAPCYGLTCVKHNGPLMYVYVQMRCLIPGGKKGGREERREGEREGGRERGRERGREGGREDYTCSVATLPCTLAHINLCLVLGVRKHIHILWLSHATLHVEKGTSESQTGYSS